MMLREKIYGKSYCSIFGIDDVALGVIGGGAANMGGSIFSGLFGSSAEKKRAAAIRPPAKRCSPKIFRSVIPDRSSAGIRPSVMRSSRARTSACTRRSAPSESNAESMVRSAVTPPEVAMSKLTFESEISTVTAALSASGSAVMPNEKLTGLNCAATRTDSNRSR